MATRYKIDVMGDIASIEARIVSNRKFANSSTNATSVKIADATLPALQRKLTALREELEQAPERPPLTTGYSSFRMTERRTPMTAAEQDMLAIPDFLRRTM